MQFKLWSIFLVRTQDHVGLMICSRHALASLVLVYCLGFRV